MARILKSLLLTLPLVALCASGAFAAGISFVQQKTGSNTSGTTLVLPGVTSHAGDLLVLTCALSGNQNSVFGVTDTGGNTWQLAPAGNTTNLSCQNAAGGTDFEIWYAPNVAGASTVVSVAHDGAALVTNCNLSEWSGISATGFDTSSPCKTAVSATPGTFPITPNYGNDLLIGTDAQISNTTVIASPPGWTTLTAVTNLWSVLPAYQIQTQVESQSALWRTNISGPWVGYIAAFQAAASIPTPVPTGPPTPTPGPTPAPTPSQVLSGDVVGPFNNNIVVGLQGFPISTITPTNGQGICVTGGQYVPCPTPAPNVIALAGDVIGQSNTNSVIKIQGVPVATAAPSIGQILGYVSGFWQPIASSTPFPYATPTIALNGDVTGSSNANSVSAIQGFPVSAITPVNGYTWCVSGGQWIPCATATPAPTPTIALGGDVTGQSNANTLSAIVGYPVSTNTPVAGQMMGISGGQWAPVATVAGSTPGPTPTITLGGDVTGASNANTVGAIQGYPVSTTTPTANQVLISSGGKWAPAALATGATPAPTPTITLAGDVTGVSNANTVGKIQGFPVSTVTPSAGQVLTDVAGQWVPQALASGASTPAPTPTIALNGDVTGQSNANVVGKENGFPFATISPSPGQVLMYQTSNGWAPVASATPAPTPTVTLAGDVTGASSANTVKKFQGYPVSTVTPVNGQVMGVSGGNWVPVASASPFPYATPTITLSGDVTGASSANTVTKLQGYPISTTTPVAGQELIAVGGKWVPTATPSPVPTTVPCSYALEMSATGATTSGSAAGSTLLQQCSVVNTAQNVNSMICTTDVEGGTCTTPPIFNVRDDTTGMTGVNLTCPSLAGRSTQFQNGVTLNPSDYVCITRVGNSSGCTNAAFGITAQVGCIPTVTPTPTATATPTGTPTPTPSPTPSPTPTPMALDYYVNSSATGCSGSPCSNNNNGTSLATAFATISKAATVVTAGKKVGVVANSVAYDATVTLTVAGTSGNPIVFEVIDSSGNAAPAVTSINSQGTPPTLAATTALVGTFQVNCTAAFNQIIGFEIHNTTHAESTLAHGINIGNGSPVTCTNGSGIGATNAGPFIQSNYIHNLCEEGIDECGTNSSPTCNVNGTILDSNYIYQPEMAGWELDGVNYIARFNKVNGTTQSPANCGTARGGADADGSRAFGSGGSFFKNEFYGITFGSAPNINPHTDCMQSWGPLSNFTYDSNLCRWPAPAGTANGAAGNEGGNLDNSVGLVDNITYQNNIYYNMRQGVLADQTRSSGTMHVYMLNETYDTIQQSAPQLLADASGGTLAITVRNMIFYQVGNGTIGGAGQFDEAISCCANGLAGCSGHTGTMTLTQDHNDWFTSGGSPGTWKSSNCTLAAMGSAPASTANPLFITPEGNWNLQAGSPMPGAGFESVTPPQPTNDYNQNPWANPPGIGAIE